MPQIKLFNKTIFIKDIVITLVIIVLPFIFYTYKLIPADVKVFENSFFRLETIYYIDLQTFFWTSSIKLLTLSIMFIWFLTCKHWWRYAIIVPIIIEMNKLLVVP